MTIRQFLLRKLYPVFMAVNQWFSLRKTFIENKNMTVPNQSFYDLSLTDNDGNWLEMKEYKGKKLLLVNTASDCGFTAQLKELQALQDQFADKLKVIGFPSNDFNNQEAGTDEEIIAFCQKNYNLSFTLAKKSKVCNGALQNKIFRWLTHSAQNGWHQHQPEWNFSKYLVNENGILTHYFGPAISPMSQTLKSKI